MKRLQSSAPVYRAHSPLTSPLTLTLGLALMGGCDFIDSASALTFGAGDVPEISQEMLYPSVNELTGLNGEGDEEVFGLPSDLSSGTMAHLVGALGAQG